MLQYGLSTTVSQVTEASTHDLPHYTLLLEDLYTWRLITFELKNITMNLQQMVMENLEEESEHHRGPD